MPRLGSIQFINSLPVDLGFLSGEIPLQADIRVDAPTGLNEAMLLGRLDVSPVSALHYAEHSEQLLLLPDLSISSESSVDSVLLFSRRPIAELAACHIGLTTKGHTTPALLKIICQERYGFAPQCEPLPAQPGLSSTQLDAILLIGDEALVFKEKLPENRYFVTDLAEEWRQWSGLPFVFAVWAVRREYYTAKTELVHEIHEKLLKSKQWGLNHMDRVLTESRLRTGLPEEALRRYFSKLSFDFDENLKRGLKRYVELACQYGFMKTPPNFKKIESMRARMQA